MKTFLAYMGIIIAIGFTNLKAQTNLVPNYSFEQIDSCPTQLSELDPTCKDWFTPWSLYDTINNIGSSDIYHKCCTTDVGVPSNINGWQNSRTSKAYAGFGLLVSQPYTGFVNYKEYIEIKLLKSLQKERRYCAEYYYSVGDLEHLYTKYYPANIGLFVSDTIVKRYKPFGYLYPKGIIAAPQISQMLPNSKDTMNWIKVSGSFIAKGGEQYLTIGNFQNTDTLKSIGVYVYIDDVKLWYCDSGDTINPVLPKELKVYPIPTNDKNITFEYVNGDLDGYHLLIYNSIGQKVYSYTFNESISLKQFQFIRFSSGMYHFTLRSEEKINYDGKIIILE